MNLGANPKDRVGSRRRPVARTVAAGVGIRSLPSVPKSDLDGCKRGLVIANPF
jgi:hypothetical protein